MRLLSEKLGIEKVLEFPKNLLLYRRFDMRKFLVSLICLIVTFVLASSSLSLAATPQSQYNSLADYEKAIGKKITKFNESPMLSALVKQGKLPPVEKRLPSDPVVIKPLEKVGKYGGTLRTSSIAAHSLLGPHVILMGEGLLRTDSDYKTIVPNLAVNYSLSKDGKTLTLHLRRGIKWSDGLNLHGVS